MAQLAIPLLLLGTAYLVSNDKSKNKNKAIQEGFAELDDVQELNGNLLKKSYDTYTPNMGDSELKGSNEGSHSSFQDKF